LEQRLPFRLAVLSRLLDRHATRTLARYNISLSTYRILLTIDAFGDISPVELTRYTVVDKAQISRQTTELLKNEWTSAVPDPNRPRRKRLRLTSQGHALMAAIMPAMNAREARFAEQLDVQVLDTLVTAIEKLTDHVAADLAEA
jgi:DNA-binding MarR family transcriptional regulator